MNIQNIDKAIAIMQRAQVRDSVDMMTFQTSKDSGSVAVSTEEEFHACGNTACFAGHIAISPEWEADGGKMRIHGAPYIVVDDDILGRNYALSYWFGISDEITDLMIYNYRCADEGNHRLYGVAWEDVRAEHVIRILEELKDLGESDFMKKYNIQ